MNKLITKITAPNGGVFTGQGTNTYLIGQEDITLVDPGPNIKEHIEAILKKGEEKIKRILVTHTHTDHSPAALPISKELNIPMFGRLIDRESEWEDYTFIPDTVLSHGDVIDTDENAYQRYLAGKKARQDAKEKQLNNEVDLKSVKGDLDQLKGEITEIKTLLNELVSKWHIF